MLSSSVSTADVFSDGAGAPHVLVRAAPAGVGYASLGYGAGGPVWLDAFHSKRPPLPHELVNAYKGVAHACVGLNAEGVVKVPLRLYARTGRGQKKPRRAWRPVGESQQRHLRTLPHLARTLSNSDDVQEIVDHPLLDALERPNPFFDRPTFLAYLTVCLDVIGQAFVFPTRPTDPRGLPDTSWSASELWPLQAQYVYPVKGAGEGSGVLLGWRFFDQQFLPAEIVRARWISARDPYLSAYAPLHACYEQAGLVDYWTASIEGILKGGAMPAAIVGPKEGLQRWGDAEKERLEFDIHSKLAGPNKGRFWVTNGAFDVKTLSYPPADLGGLELTKEQRLLVANCMGVPISLLQTEDSNRATARESTHQHQVYGVAPRCRILEAALTHQLAALVDDRLFFAFDNPVDRDRDLDSKVFDVAIRNNSRTINEVRAEDNLPPVEWGDAPFDPSKAAPAPSHAEPDGDEAETSASEKPTAAPGAEVQADDVQSQALNGAQISSLVEVIQNVRDGVIPAGSAKALLAAAFPALSAETIASIVDPIEVSEPEPDPSQPPPGKPPKPPAPADAPEPEPDPEPDAERSARNDLYRRFALVLDALEDRLS